MDASSGLAGRIRRTQESDEFDLAGYTKEQCGSLVQAAFGEPLPLASMVRITFTVGGGKQCRQKYSDDLVKDMCNALSAIGFSEDKAAACELNCAMSFKYQHDTSKNLKFVHVFPNVAPAAATGAADAGGGETAKEAPQRQEPPDLLAQCEFEDFRRHVEAKVCGYTAKKRLMEELKARIQRLEAIEKKLIDREQPSADEQAFYDSHSVEGLKEKVQIIAKELQAVIDDGHLTAWERPQVTEQLAEKLAAIDVDIEKAESEGKAKKVQMLGEQRDKLKRMKVAVAGALPWSLPVRHGDEIRRLRGRLAKIAQIEKQSSGKYAIDELKIIGEKSELEEAIGTYSERSRLWFETAEEFQARLQTYLREVGSAGSKKKPQADDSFATVSRPASSSSASAQTKAKSKRVYTKLA